MDEGGDAAAGADQRKRAAPQSFSDFAIYDMIPAKRGFQKPVGEWNSEEITAMAATSP